MIQQTDWLASPVNYIRLKIVQQSNVKILFVIQRAAIFVRIQYSNTYYHDPALDNAIQEFSLVTGLRQVKMKGNLLRYNTPLTVEVFSTSVLIGDTKMSKQILLIEQKLF